QGKIRIHNYHHFTNLNELNAEWQVQVDGETVQSGTIKLNIAPQRAEIISLPMEFENLNPGLDAFLTISLKLPQRTSWAEQGHEITFEQFRLPVERKSKKRIDPTDEPLLELTENAEQAKITGQDFSYIFNKSSGDLSSIIFKGVNLIDKGPALSIRRPVIPNETSNWGTAEARSWRSNGLDHLAPGVVNISVERISQHEVEVVVEKIHYQTSVGNKEIGFEEELRYNVLATGDIILQHRITPLGEMPWLQKIGLHVTLPPEFQKFQWYGYGPEETYPDRKNGIKIGLYEGTVDEQYVPYVMPQEFGNKTGVRWAALTNADGIGLLAVAEQEMNVSVWNYDMQNIENAVYAFQLKKADHVTFNIDHRVSGVGGTPVSPRVKYRVYPEIFEYQVRLRPFSSAENAAIELSAELLSF
ncbi:DUF4981 domain-containing protein, partial [candidate division KSB1 bacterium]|nr:DUF4981 domain-containing protein [candidate division KSB1 bacterium]